MKQKNIYFYTNLFAWALVLFLIGNYAFGWVTPITDPPEGDLSPPLDTSSTAQTKTGDLTIDSLFKVGRYSSAPTGSTGALYYDTSASEFKGYTTSSWDSLGGGASLWTQTGNDIYYNTGNVGIGTTTPGYKLDVAGELRWQDMMYANAGNFAYSGNTYNILYAGSAGLGINDQTDTQIFVKITDTGNVGLGGESAPGSKLSVKGGISVGETQTWARTAAPTGGMIIKGNVGIGTTTPNNLLQVYDLIDFNNTDANTKLGYQAGKNIVSGAQYNTFVGYQAGMATSTGSTGDDNIAVGAWTFWSNTTGWFNTAIGNYSLMYNTSGNDNTAIGAYSLQDNTTGEYNTAVGKWSLANNTSGYDNTAIGGSSLVTNSIGVANTGLGVYSLYSNTSGERNTAVGAYSAYSSNGTYNNTSLGAYSLYSNTYGEYNTALGEAALQSNTIASYNTAVGMDALVLNTEGECNTAVGTESLRMNTTGEDNVAIGWRTLYSNTTGIYNTAIGNYSLYANTEGNYNSAMGRETLRYNTTGLYNTAVGYYALRSNTTGDNNTAIGRDSLYSNTTSNYNTAVGYYSLRSNTTGTSNSAMGNGALTSNTEGNSNTAMGSNALRSNTTGLYNTAVGTNALYKNTTGDANTSMGHYSLYSNTTGTYNIAMGQYAGRYTGDFIANATSTNSLYLGYYTKSLASGDTNEIVIGFNTTGLGSNSAVLGNDSITKTILKGNVGIGMTEPTYQLQLSTDSAAKPTSNAWTIASDIRVKEDIEPFTDGLNVINQLNPITYKLNGKAGFIKGQAGISIIANDVKDIIPYSVSTYKAKLEPTDAEETELYDFDSSPLTFVTINAIKELNNKVKVLEVENEALNKRIEILETR